MQQSDNHQSSAPRGDKSSASRLAWFDSLYAAHHRRAFGLALSFLGNPRDAEDTVQEAFLSIWRSQACPDPSGESTLSWLLAIVRNRSIDVLRSRKRKETYPLDPDVDTADSIDVPIEVERRTAQRHAHRILERLPVEQRRVMELVYFEGLTHAEIAEHLNLPLGTVKSRIRLALEHLRLYFPAREDPPISA
ncbi:MAG TPA: RNA polymerase sigma factor [Chloroflexota bacterium]|nr:RNA polymerase sigma factor [Chloroflexota bacterium]